MVAILSVFVLYGMGLRWNITSSVPLGIYVEDASREARRGDYVRTCVPENWQEQALSRGYIGRGIGCVDYTQALVKRVVGQPGDSIEVSELGVYVNGSLLEGSKPLRRDRVGDFFI